MVRKMIGVCVMLTLLYAGFIQIQLWLGSRRPALQDKSAKPEVSGNKIYSFAFSKYSTSGNKEWEIEGDSANIFSRNIVLKNVIARALAQESPITITADDGVFDKSTNNVHLENNVIATTKNGARLLTEQLDIQPNEKTVATDVRARVKRDNINVEGIGATGDSELKQVEFKKNVTVIIKDPNTETNTPTIITSDGPLEIDYEENIAHFSQNVVTKDERGQLVADFMDVFYDSKTKKVYKVIATGNVVITNKDGNVTYSDNAIYLAAEGKIILGGDVEAVGNKKSSGSKSEKSGLELLSWGKPAKEGKKR